MEKIKDKNISKISTKKESEQEKIADLKQLFKKAKKSADSIPKYIQMQDLVSVANTYKQIYDLLEAPTKEEVTAIIEDNLRETYECAWYNLFHKRDLSAPLGDKALLEDESIRQEVLASALNRVFNTQRGDYGHIVYRINKLRTIGYKFIEILLGKVNADIIEKYDLDINDEMISFDSYSRIIEAINNGIDKLYWSWKDSWTMEPYKSSIGLERNSFIPDEDVEIDLNSPLSFLRSEVLDTTLLRPTQKQLTKRNSFSLLSDEEVARMI